MRRFDGDLDDYRDWVLGRKSPTEAVPGGPTGDRRAQKRVEAEARQRLSDQRKPLQQKLDRIEKELEALNAEKRELDVWLAAPEAYLDENKERLKTTLARHGDIGWQLARMETQWLEANEALERISA